MKTASFFLFTTLFIGVIDGSRAEAAVKQVSVCVLEENAESLLHSKVELQVDVRLGSEHPLLYDGGCSFRFAFGDDYQTYGNRFSAKKNAEWRLMRSLLINSDNKNDCPFFVRAIKARFRGVVEREPATGTIPPDEMPFEIIFRSVFHVETIPIHCVNEPTSNRTGP